MAKYLRQDPKGGNGKRGKSVILTVLLCFVIIAGAVFAFFWSKLDLIQYDNEINYGVYSGTEPAEKLKEVLSTEGEDTLHVDISGLEMVETVPVIPQSEIFDRENVLNILLIGTDERTEEFNTNARSDSMILVSIDKDANTVKLVSLERGVAVPILEGQYKGEYDLLTHVFRYGGAELLTKTVEHCFKVDVDHYVRLNFHSVKQIVDAVGGIEIDMTKAEAEALNQGLNRNGGARKRLQAGINSVDGQTALDFARLRAIDSDWQRVGRQRKVILAVVEKLKGSGLLTLNELADQVLPLVQTNFSKLEIAELLLYAPNFLQAEFDQMTIPKQGTYGGMTIMGGGGGFAVDYEVNNALLHDFLYGSEEKAE